MNVPAHAIRIAPFARTPRRRRSSRHGAGMTLLELLIVLSLMGLIAVMAVPYLSGGVSGSELKGAAREVAAGLRNARSGAVSSRKETRLVLDLEQRTFQIDSDNRTHALPKGLELKLFTAQRDLVDAKSGAIRFFPDGGSNGGRITIASGERKYEVDVDWLTGRVAILD